MDVRKSKTLIFVGSFITSLILVFAFFLSSASAQSYRGLIIDALRFDFDKIMPGQSVTGSFNITYDYRPNPDGTYKDATLFFIAKDFTQGNNPGSPKFLSADELPEASRMSEWITYNSDQITLNQPGQKHKVEFTVTVPENADPGGKYTAIFVSNYSGEDAANQVKENGEIGFGLNASLAPLIFLTVDGEVNKSLNIQNFYTENVWGQKTTFFFNPPVSIVAEFINNGNVHVAPRGKVYVHKGNNYVADNLYTFDINIPNKEGYRTFVLPNTKRPYIFNWQDSFISTNVIEYRGDEEKNIILKEGDEDFDNYPIVKKEYKTNYDWDKLSKFRLGWYNVTLQYDIESEDGSSTPITTTLTIFIFPWQLLVLIAILLLLVLFIFVKKIRNKRKSKNTAVDL